MPSRWPLHTLLATLLLTSIGSGQSRGSDPTRTDDGLTKYVVQFTQRSFDLSAFRAANRRRAPHREIQRLVRALEAAVRRDQRDFVTSVQRLGGRVTAQWWLINGCAIDLPAARLAAVRALPNVSRVDRDQVRRPHLLQATNSSHHGSDQANRKKTKSGALVTGKGVTVAVLDTGADAVSGTKNRPHACYYPQGNPNNNKNGGIGGSLLLAALKVPQVRSTEDVTGHGTSVMGCATANKWNASTAVDNAIAPGAGVVSVNIANSLGISLDSWMVSGWQVVSAVRTKFHIGVGNNSFDGSPSLSNALQIALDSTARNADILICVSAGNRGTNTKDSQHAFNGLAVGSVDKTWLSKSAFSAIGPLDGTKRTYPDITAVGNGVITVLRDNEASKIGVGGTSYAAPMVAGIAALVRQADPTLDANQVRALLLNTSAFRSSNRNHYGIGFAKADAAVDAALAGHAARGTVVANRATANYEFAVPTAGMTQVTVAWMRNLKGPVPANLDLRIYDGKVLVASDLNPENSYESVRFSALANRKYRAEIRWANAGTSTGPVRFAIACECGPRIPLLTQLTPTATPSYLPSEIEIHGKGLGTVTQLTLDGNEVPFLVMDETTIRFTPKINLPIATHTIRAHNPSGSSNTLTLQITAPPKPIFAGDPFVVKGPKKYSYWLYSDRQWLSLLTVSLSNKPSKLTGVFDLGIGNNFSELVLLLYLNQDTTGKAKIELSYPSSVPSGTQIYYQAMTVDPTKPTLPYPVTNILPVKIF